MNTDVNILIKLLANKAEPENHTVSSPSLCFPRNNKACSSIKMNQVNVLY